ncbi:MAG: hypothetical protein EOM51_06290 [Clostridia bacterium]|nr:hypothetical protein [Clostridia bacterium]
MKDFDRPILQRNRSVEQYYDTSSVESSTGMTGLTPTPPLSDEEEESYSDIYGMPTPSTLHKSRKKKK